MPNPINQPGNTEDIFAPVDPAGRKPASARPVRRTVVPYRVPDAKPANRGGFPARTIYLIIIAAVVVLVVGGVLGLAWWRNRSQTSVGNQNQNVNQPATNVNNNSAGAVNQNSAPVLIPNANVPTNAITDTDRDGLGDSEEAALGTNQQSSDTDADGLSDLLEIRIYRSDPLRADTDNNGTSDGDEVRSGDNPSGAGPLYDLSNKL